MRTATWSLSLFFAALLATESVARRPPRPPAECPADLALAVATACPCDGLGRADGGVDPWRNHGRYVSCTVRYRNALRKAGCLTDEAKRTIARCAARSTCGKDGAVLCCVYEPCECSDPLPGDGTAAGVCSDDALTACDTDADCTKSTSSVARDEAACLERGGTPVGTGSVCAPCPPPVQ
jgi:hypothetical protein